MLAEIVENPLPKRRARHDVHKHPLYYAVRNHIIDFLVDRSRGFIAEAGATYDPRHVPVVRPGAEAPADVSPFVPAKAGTQTDKGRANGPGFPFARERAG